MVDQRRIFTGASFLTIRCVPTVPVWEPLEDLSRIVQQEPDLLAFHPGEFMYMGTVRGGRPSVTIRLYKHVDTRRYLNLDDGGHAYAYRHRETDPLELESGGRYQRYGNVLWAVDALELWMFETARLFRSFPPDQWPPESQAHISPGGSIDAQ